MAGGAFGGARESARYIGELTEKLRSLSGLPLGEIGDQLKQIITEAKTAVQELGNVKAAAKSAEQELADLNTQLAKVGAEAVRGYQGVVWGESFTPEQTKTLFRPGGVAGPEELALVGRLQSLSSRLKSLGGPDNYFAQLIDKEIPYLTSGARTASEASQMLLAIFSAFRPGLQQEENDPTKSAAFRALAQELERYIDSGRFN